MRRLHPTAREYDRLLGRQGGKCCEPGCEETEGLIAEHSTPNALYPGEPDQLMCKPRHKVKTLRHVKAIAKVKRLSGAAMSQYERRKKYGPRLKGRVLVLSRSRAGPSKVARTGAVAHERAQMRLCEIREVKRVLSAPTASSPSHRTRASPNAKTTRIEPFK